MALNLACRRCDFVDPIVQQRRHEQALSVRRDGHVVGTPCVQRALPQESAARNIERRDVAEISAGNVECSAIGRDISVLSVIWGARSLALCTRRIDIDYSDY